MKPVTTGLHHPDLIYRYYTILAFHVNVLMISPLSRQFGSKTSITAQPRGMG
jgi:hypothetical protein